MLRAKKKLSKTYVAYKERMIIPADPLSLYELDGADSYHDTRNSVDLHIIGATEAEVASIPVFEKWVRSPNSKCSDSVDSAETSMKLMETSSCLPYLASFSSFSCHTVLVLTVEDWQYKSA